MIYIAHRGNINGQIKEKENCPEYISKALDLGFDVEVDVNFVHGNFYLGHDRPQYKVDISFLMNDKIWCHIKTIKTLEQIHGNKNLHYFWHENDKYTLTSRGVIWTYPRQILFDGCVMNQPEFEETSMSNTHDSILRSAKKYATTSNCYGICSDFVQYLRDKI